MFHLICNPAASVTPAAAPALEWPETPVNCRCRYLCENVPHDIMVLFFTDGRFTIAGDESDVVTDEILCSLANDILPSMQWTRQYGTR